MGAQKRPLESQSPGAVRKLAAALWALVRNKRFWAKYLPVDRFQRSECRKSENTDNQNTSRRLVQWRTRIRSTLLYRNFRVLFITFLLTIYKTQSSRKYQLENLVEYFTVSVKYLTQRSSFLSFTVTLRHARYSFSLQSKDVFINFITAIKIFLCSSR